MRVKGLFNDNFASKIFGEGIFLLWKGICEWRDYITAKRKDSLRLKPRESLKTLHYTLLTLHSQMRPQPHLGYFFISLMMTCISAVDIFPSPLRS